MPSPVPAGYTRGPILFLGEIQSPAAEQKLLQRFWDEAGSYGARIVLIESPAAALNEKGSFFAAQLAEWECDSVTLLTVATRTDARQSAAVEKVHAATAILFLGDDPLRLAMYLGGTPLAQGVRRANAQGKAVGAVGGCASILCQHMIAVHPLAGDAPSIRSVHFAPGLGIVNRMALDAALPGNSSRLATDRLLAAVAHNPFLVGVRLDADTGAVIYPDTTLEIFGDGSALLVDGHQIIETNLYEASADTPLTVVGAQVHVLGRGYTFNFDTHEIRPPAADAALQVEAVKAAF